MSNNLVVNADTLKQKITERVISSFSDLIPEEVFSRMVDETVKMFFTTPQQHVVSKTQVDNGWNRPRHDETKVTLPMTTFQVMVWEQVQPIVAAKLKTYFEQEKQALTDSMADAFATDLKQPVAYNVACLTHALGQAHQMQIVQRAMDMMHMSLNNLACHLNMPIPAHPIVSDGNEPQVRDGVVV